LVDADPTWRDRYAEEAARIRLAVGGNIDDIQHVGSTAVPGLLSKPVIDIAIAVTTEAAADACIAPLAALGYAYRGAHGDDPRRRYYVRDDRTVRVTQVHLYILPATAWHEKLAFRDALRADPQLAAAYAAEKRRVAELVGWDKSAYAEAKGPFVRTVLERLGR
jgi:GrpB-like predicted nucleotidyltransferase (UPF0157 family)